MPRTCIDDSKQWARGSVAGVWAKLREPDKLETYLAIGQSLGLTLNSRPLGPEHEDWRRPMFVPRRTDVAWAREQIARHVAKQDILLSAHVPATALLPAKVKATKVANAEIEIELDETTASWYDPDALETIDADKDAWDYVEPEPTEIANKRPKLRVHWRV